MIRIFFDASTFELVSHQDGQNPYITLNMKELINHARATKQHQVLMRAFTMYPTLLCTLPRSLPTSLPDIVYCASAGLSLPRRSLVLLPRMKYHQRRAELPYIKQFFDRIQLPYMEYPGTHPFEGQAELKWFCGGRKAVLGYGHRSTKHTATELRTIFDSVYGKDAPELLALPLQTSMYYHLDLAMLDYADTKCIIHRSAFSPASIRTLERFLGPEHVTVIHSHDPFCLNAVVEGAHLITHRLTDPTIKSQLEHITGLTVKQVDTREFEKSGGAVRCMMFDVWT
jgi:N-dimethylarginine dimethylaminohydrolase